MSTSLPFASTLRESTKSRRTRSKKLAGVVAPSSCPASMVPSGRNVIPKDTAKDASPE